MRRSSGGCSDTAFDQVTVNPIPVAAFSTTGVCEDQPVPFDNTSSISDGTPLDYYWNLGDNTIFAGSFTGHLYPAYGTYTVNLIVVSQANCSDTITHTVDVHPFPHAALEISSSTNFACIGDPALFQDRSTIPVGAINSWTWSLGDGTAAFTSTTSHPYAADGEYPVNLLISSSFGCMDSTSGLIRIVPLPVADFATTNVCFGVPSSFNSLSYSLTGSIASYSWTIGTPGVFSDSAFSHIYNAAGSYDVSLEVVSDSGCVMSVTRPGAVMVMPPPPVSFSDNSSTASDLYPTVDFNNNTGVLGTYYWSFGDGDTSSLYSPTHVYGDTGHYIVQLIAIDTLGCVDTLARMIEIRATSFVYIPNSFTPDGDQKNERFQVYCYNVNSVVGQIYNRQPEGWL